MVVVVVGGGLWRGCLARSAPAKGRGASPQFGYTSPPPCPEEPHTEPKNLHRIDRIHVTLALRDCLSAAYTAFVARADHKAVPRLLMTHHPGSDVMKSS